FSSLTNETGDGTPWTWTLHKYGSHTTASTGGVVTSPASPKDPVAGGSLQVTAQSSGSTQASLGFHPETGQGKHNWRTNLTRQTLSLEVLPTSIGAYAYLELLIGSSYHPASGGRPAGKYSISYRFGGSGSPGQRQQSKNMAIVTVPCNPGVWNSVVLTPDADLKAVFPDLDSRDFSLFDIKFNAVSKRSAKASGNFDYLRFTRPTTGEVALTVQDEMMASYAGRYPGVTQQHGLELSYADPHINWFGGGIALPNYAGIKRSEYLDFMRGTVIPDVHRSGGLASYNHPFGTGDQLNPLPLSTQDQMLRDVATKLLSNNALDTDILEVGYPLREGVDLAHHVDLWDVCSRNGIFLTANGVSDDHAGDRWSARPTWTTSVWAGNANEAALLNALKSGQAWCGSMTQHRGALDLLVDGSCPMGSVSISSLPERRLKVTATSVPVGGSVDVVQRPVDYAGAGNPSPGTPVIKTLPATALSTGTTEVRMTTDQSSFVRTQVRDSTGTVIALSNPVWLLRENPPGGRAIPAARAC
ncbi:MAG: hypothetical protein M3313_06380, partial [Actinomycetota bacterium]|nr:hypothetical protein [Actinomycetota bacterium]